MLDIESWRFPEREDWEGGYNQFPIFHLLSGTGKDLGQANFGWCGLKQLSPPRSQ